MTDYQRALDDVGHQSYDEQGRRLTVDRIAERMGERASYLRKALSAYDDAHPLNAAKVVSLTLTTRNHALVRYFCDATGGVFLLLPSVTAANLDVVEQAGRAAREFGDVMVEASTALADGRVTREEAAAFAKQTREAIAALAQFEHLMNVKAGIAPPLLHTNASCGCGVETMEAR